MIHHHLRRLRRHGQLEALAPATRGPVGADRRAAARGQRARGADRRRERAAARWPRRSAARSATCTSARGTSSPTSTPARASAAPVRELLAEAAERVPVRVLVWAGAPVPVFTAAPRRTSRRARERARAAARRSSASSTPHGALMHCHHEKLVIVDDEVAFVGGIDLTALAGDRYDSNEHPHKERRSAGTTRRRGCAGRSSRDVAAHFALRWEAVAGQALELPEDARAAPATRPSQFVRTVPEGAYRVLPRGEFSILEAYMRALRSAAAADLPREPVPVVAGDRRRSSRASCATRRATTSASSSCSRTRPTTARTTRAGCSAGSSPPTTARERFLAATIQSRTGERSGPLYVHAKIGIVDDALAGDRLGQPQRALRCSTTPRSTSSPATRRSPARRACGCGPSTSSATDVDGDPATRRSTSSGARSRPSSSSAGARGEPLTHHLVELARRVAPLAAAARPARRAGGRRLANDDGPVAVHEHAVLEVPLDGAGEHRALDVAAEPDHRLGVLAVARRARRPAR